LAVERVADALLHGRRNDETGLQRSFGSEGRVDVDGLEILAGAAVGRHLVGKRVQIIGDGGDAGLRLGRCN